MHYGGKPQKTNEQFQKELSEKIIDENGQPKLVNLEPYKTSSTKIKFKCLICGNEFYKEPTYVLSNKYKYSCPECYNKNRNSDKRNSLDKVKNTINNIIDEDGNQKYKLLSNEYKNNRTKLHLLCNKCNLEFTIRYNDLQNNHGCPKCGHEKGISNIRKTLEEFKLDVKNNPLGDGDDYEVLSEEYTSNKDDILMKHKLCGNSFLVSPNNFLDRMNRCPFCKFSKGETFIYNFLKRNNIEFVSQKRFSSCKDKRELPFDFYIPDLNLCIEYDGMQHFEKCNFTGKMSDCIINEKMEIIKKHDQIKNNFCKENNIKLVRFNYKQSFSKIENELNELIK